MKEVMRQEMEKKHSIKGGGDKVSSVMMESSEDSDDSID